LSEAERGFEIKTPPKNMFKYDPFAAEEKKVQEKMDFGGRLAFREGDVPNSDIITHKNDIGVEPPQTGGQGRPPLQEGELFDHPDSFACETFPPTPQRGIVDNLIIIGQVFDTYILAQNGNDLLILDQHAAHEWMTYEKLIAQSKDGALYPQVALEPVVLDLSKAEYNLIFENIEVYQKAGFLIEEFGQNSIIIRQMPFPMNQDQVQDAILGVVGDLSENKNIEFEQLCKKAFFSVACKGSVRGGKKLSIPEMERLFKDALNLSALQTCPHGRPIVITLSRYFIEKQFRR